MHKFFGSGEVFSLDEWFGKVTLRVIYKISFQGLAAEARGCINNLGLLIWPLVLSVW